MITNSEWAAQFHRELTGNILPFWMRYTVDHENGGFYGAIDCDLRVDQQAARAAVINARILWTFSAAARVLGDSAYCDIADHAYHYIANKFWDQQYGGIYWMLDYLGNPISDRKQVYAQAFAAYGLAEYFRLTGCAAALGYAQELYRLIEEKSGDPDYGGYLEARARDWSALDDLRLSEKDLNCPKSMNTHLHVLEAYTNLLRVWDDTCLRASLRRLLELTIDRVVTGNHFQMFFDDHWVSLTDHISFGHDIEGSWLLLEAAEVLGDPALLDRARALAVKMADAVWSGGLDRDGSIFYESSGGRMVDPNKHWWAQAEAVVGFYNAYQVSGETRFRAAAYRAWQYIADRVVDNDHGEWHAKLKPDGTPYKPEEDSDACLVGAWKCPYHNSRMCLEMMERLH